MRWFIKSDVVLFILSAVAFSQVSFNFGLNIDQAMSRIKNGDNSSGLAMTFCMTTGFKINKFVYPRFDIGIGINEDGNILKEYRFSNSFTIYRKGKLSLFISPGLYIWDGYLVHRSMSESPFYTTLNGVFKWIDLLFVLKYRGFIVELGPGESIGKSGIERYEPTKSVSKFTWNFKIKIGVLWEVKLPY